MKREIETKMKVAKYICILKDKEEWIWERPKRDLQEYQHLLSGVIYVDIDFSSMER